MMQIAELKNHKSHRRGAAGQQRKRDMERSIRLDALAFHNRSRSEGISSRESAELLYLRTGTLSDWQRGFELNQLQPTPRGRPAEDSGDDARQDVLAALLLFGPDVGLEPLRAVFPDMARSELEYHQRRFRALTRRACKTLVYALRWNTIGTVWAMDFYKPPKPIDNQYPAVLAVRDLASGFVLANLPVPSMELIHVADALSVLFEQHGPPLVLKSDNSFDVTKVYPHSAQEHVEGAQRLANLFRENQVIQLLSPPYWPQYNGSIEAGVGSLKTRAHYEAARHGRPCEWTCDDLEAARLYSNELAKPWGFNAPSPEIKWAERSPILPDERWAFHASVQQAESNLRQLKQSQLLEGVPLGAKDSASLRREAISRVLVDHGFLTFRRMRFTLPFNRKNA
jgi:transposase InsO family protein